MLEKVFNGNFMPHGYCLQWQDDILYMMLIGDGLTTISYALIPIALIYLVKKRDDLSFNYIFVLFAAFIAFCGITHAINILNLWHGYYFISGLAKVATGLVSILTTIMLWRLMPQFLAVPSNQALIKQHEALQKAHFEIESANLNLERKVKERTKELEKLANTDQLTGLKNRRAVLQILDYEIKKSNRYQDQLSIAMLDLDHFKLVNDTYGHLEGDALLQDLAGVITEACRETDTVGRYGGEEFLILMPKTTLADATTEAERIRQAVAQFVTRQNENITCSIGVTTYNPSLSLTEFIKSADDRTYLAKEKGRNQVVSDDV